MTKLLKKSSKRAFTMAEILLSLTIIGVVAAITLPSLTGNINERTWNTQRKALYARLSQGMALMPALNGLGTYSVETDSAGSTSVTDTAAQAFVTELGNVLKINNVCDNTHLQDCGIVSKIMPMGGTSEIDVPTTLTGLNGAIDSSLDTKAVAFETQNGESIVAYYNRSCKTEYLNELSSQTNSYGSLENVLCVNFIYDLNGQKGPNTVGKDIGFITVLNASDSTVVAPMPSSVQNASSGTDWEGASSACTTQDTDSRLPNVDELAAMWVNEDLISLTANSGFWSGSVYGADKAWYVNTTGGLRGSLSKDEEKLVRCIRR